jgi:hypothetical protein
VIRVLWQFTHQDLVLLNKAAKVTDWHGLDLVSLGLGCCLELLNSILEQLDVFELIRAGLEPDKMVTNDVVLNLISLHLACQVLVRIGLEHNELEL